MSSKYIPIGAEWMKEIWIPALRDGRYQQGREHLRVGDSYCCLGVACDLRGMEWKSALSPNMPRPNNVGVLYEVEGSDMFFPISVQDFLGVTYTGRYFDPEYASRGSLSRLNDDGATFDEIADVIEKCLDPENLAYGFCDPREYGRYE